MGYWAIAGLSAALQVIGIFTLGLGGFVLFIGLIATLGGLPMTYSQPGQTLYMLLSVAGVPFVIVSVIAGVGLIAQGQLLALLLQIAEDTRAMRLSEERRAANARTGTGPVLPPPYRTYRGMMDTRGE